MSNKGQYWKGKKRPDISIMMSKRCKGIKFNAEHKRKLSEAHKGKSSGMKGKHISKEHKEILSEIAKHRTGSKSGNWKGGLTPENHRIRNSLEYRLWRKSVFERDGYACVWCRDKSRPGHPVILNADHIKPFAEYPELRFAIDNGRTLCRKCHLTTDTIGRRKKC